MALSSASESREGGALDRSNGSGMRGVTGLRTSAGKSRMLGESMSGLRGEKNEVRGLMLRLFLREFVLRSYSLNCCCFLFGTDFMGGMLWVGLAAGFEEACFAVSEEPVSIWTTCLKEDVSAWTNVVGYGLPGSDLATALGDCSPCHGLWLSWCLGDMEWLESMAEMREKQKEDEKEIDEWVDKSED